MFPGNFAEPIASENALKALFDYTCKEDNELSFKAGDLITVLQKFDGWYMGELKGKVGLFPSNFVETPKKAAPKKVKAFANYQAQEDNEISFKEDDIITIVEEFPDSAWCVGKLANGTTGMFPSNFTKEIS